MDYLTLHASCPRAPLGPLLPFDPKQKPYMSSAHLSKDASVGIPAIQLGQCCSEVAHIQSPVVLVPECILYDLHWQCFGPFCCYTPDLRMGLNLQQVRPGKRCCTHGIAVQQLLQVLL